MLALALGAGTACSSAAPAVHAAPTPARDDDPAEARGLRERLVRRIAARYGSVDARVLDAMRAVPRHRFVDAPLPLAYRDRPLPIGWGQTISQPAVVALMTSALELTGTEKVLEIGTGSGYQAAVLSRLAAHVDTIEIVPALGELARERLGAMGYANVIVHIGDGYAGWPDDAPFDRILLTAAPPHIPEALVGQLAVGGILVAPVGEGRAQRLVRWRRTPEGMQQEDLGRILFVPMVEG